MQQQVAKIVLTACDASTILALPVTVDQYNLLKEIQEITLKVRSSDCFPVLKLDPPDYEDEEEWAEAPKGVWW